MEKIPTLFVRDESRRYVTSEVTPGCEWVLAGEGYATRKFDGTCVMFDGLDWWSRREVSQGKSTPDSFILVQTDDVTGKRVGWEPIQQSPFYRFFVEALDAVTSWKWRRWTYELCGPKVNGNPEKLERHTLIRHGEYREPVVTFDGQKPCPRNFEGLRSMLTTIYPYEQVEGLVFWRDLNDPYCEKAKIKTRDFCLDNVFAG